MKRLFLIVFLLSSCAFSQTFGNIPTAGNIPTFGTGQSRTLMAKWLMNESTGSTANDTSGSSDNVTLTNAVWNAANPGGSLGYSVTFNGTSTTAIPSTGTGITPDYNTPFSVSMWVYNLDTTSTYPRLYSTLNSSTKGVDIGLQWMSGTTYVPIFSLYSTYSSNALEIKGNSAVSSNAWHHLVYTYDGSHTPAGVKIYVDGTLQAMTTAFNSLTASVSNANKPYIGSRPTQDATTTLKGYLSTVCYNNRVLTSTEVSTMYATPGTCITY